jgi:hypothetical protein
MRISNRSQGSNLFINKIYSKNIKVKLDSLHNAQLSDSRKKKAPNTKNSIFQESVRFIHLFAHMHTHTCTRVILDSVFLTCSFFPHPRRGQRIIDLWKINNSPRAAHTDESTPKNFFPLCRYRA